MSSKYKVSDLKIGDKLKLKGSDREYTLNKEYLKYLRKYEEETGKFPISNNNELLGVYLDWYDKYLKRIIREQAEIIAKIKEKLANINKLSKLPTDDF